MADAVQLQARLGHERAGRLQVKGQMSKGKGDGERSRSHVSSRSVSSLTVKVSRPTVQRPGYFEPATFDPTRETFDLAFDVCPLTFDLQSLSPCSSVRGRASLVLPEGDNRADTGGSTDRN